MLKRLLTAVFVLGLILALNGTAFSDIGPAKAQKERLFPMTVQNSHGKLLPNSTAHSGRVLTPIPDNTPVSPRPNSSSADTVACYSQDYYLDNTAAYRINMYDASGAYIGPSDEISTMFEGPQQISHVATVDVVYAVIRYAKRAGGAPGLPVRINVYDDLGGYPGALLYSADYALPNVTAATWFSFTLPTPVSISTPKYHVSVGYGAGAVSTDSLALRVGNTPAAEGSRTKYFYLSWYDFEAVYTSVGVASMWIATDQCEVYTDCYVNAPFGGNVTLWDTPGDYWSDGSTHDGFAQRFVATGPETLKTVRFYHYDLSASYPGVFYTPSSTNGVNLYIYGDDGSGNPDYMSGPLATRSLAAGIGLFPATGLAANGWNTIDVDFSADNLVLFGPYHVAAQMTGTDPLDGQLLLPASREDGSAFNNDQSGASVNYTAPGDAWTSTATAEPWQTDVGQEVGYLIRPILCKDEFYDCHTEVLSHGLAYAYTFQNPAYGFLLDEVAQKVTASQINRVDKIRVYFARRGTGSVADLRIYANGGIDPGAVAWSTPVNVPASGWYEVVIPGGFQINGDFFVGYASTSSGPDSLRAVTDDGTVGFINGGARMLLQGYGWLSTEDIYGPGDQENLAMEVDYCSVIIPGWNCVVADWPTNAGDYARTGHSGVALSDAYCDLNLKWTFTDPNFGSNAAGGGAIQQNAPIIWDTFVVCVQNSKINILSLNSGSVLATFSGNVAPYYVAVSLVRSTPTIATIDVAGTPTPVLFYGGGSSMMAVKMQAGFPVLWDLRSANAAAKGYTSGQVSSSFTNWSAPIVANVGGNDMVFWGTQNSQILAADAETGTHIWTRTLISNPVRNLAFDGTNLYTATIAAPPTVPDGDVYSIKALDGTIVKQLTVDGALVGTSTLGSTNETFADQLAYHEGKLYTVSAYFTPEFDDEGILYILDAATFSTVATAKTQHIYQGNGLTPGANIMMHATTVIVAGGSTWTSTPLGGTVIAHNRFTGSVAWISDGGVAKTTGANLGNGFITCEGDGSDGEIYLFNNDGYLSCFDVSDGNEIFHRRIDYLSLGVTSAGAGGAISKDGIVVFGSFGGSLFALEKGADRGRLEILDYTPTTPVSFGNAPSFPVNLPAIYTNTGCATVSGNYLISTTSNGSVGPGISQFTGFDVSERASSIAEQLTASSRKAFKGAALVTINTDPTVDQSTSRSMNRAALAVPPYINNPASTPFSVNPGDTFDILLDVNQAILPRGPNKFYIAFDSDDPDFFLNNTTEDPEILVTLVGGCLIDTTELHFGAGSANLQVVANSGRLGTGDWVSDGPGNFDIGGINDHFYQGTYVYGVTRNRIALNSQDWWSGGEEADAWTSMQADQNRCSDDCKPGLQTGVSLGSITTDGITYSPLTGNLVCKDYIDSVQVFDPDGAGSAVWNWLNFETAFFDNDSTMGLSVSSSTFGAVDVPAPYEMLNDVTVEVMKVKTRNGQELNGWKFGVGIDYDIVNPDTAGIDRNISTVFAYGADANLGAEVWGIVKLPFGGGCAGDIYTPLKNVKSLDRAQSMTSPSNGGTARGNGFADSSYAWMAQPIGGSSQGNMHSTDDQDVFATFVEKDFAAGGDSAQFALAHFMMHVDGPTNSANYAPMANLLNKWVGFGRGDINDDGAVNLADIIALADNVAGSGPGAIPFAHLGDVNNDGSINSADVTYLVNYYFHYGPCPVGAFIIQ